MADQEVLELESFPSKVDHDSGASETDPESDRPASPHDEQGKLRSATSSRQRCGECSSSLEVELACWCMLV